MQRKGCKEDAPEEAASTTLTDRDEIIASLGQEHPPWLSAAYEAVEQVARCQPTLTTDNLWPLLTFPAGSAGGKAMGKVVRWALANRIMEKATTDGYLLCLDHAALAPVSTSDGIVIRHQGPLVVYRSLISKPGVGPSR